MMFSGGLPETACGVGSTLALTTSIRAWLPVLFRELGVRVLLDAPCGDMNWMVQTDLAGIDYVGCDYDRDHLATARSRISDPPAYAPLSRRLIELDVVRDPLPAADLMLCREFMQHLPNAMVEAVLSNFLTGGSPWLLATSHDNAANADITDAGMFRPLNMMLKPFQLPSPRQCVEDQPGSGRILGLWHRSDLGMAG